jgi:hypothetical protein
MSSLAIQMEMAAMTFKDIVSVGIAGWDEYLSSIERIESRILVHRGETHRSTDSGRAEEVLHFIATLATFLPRRALTL